MSHDSYACFEHANECDKRTGTKITNNPCRILVIFKGNYGTAKKAVKGIWFLIKNHISIRCT